MQQPPKQYRGESRMDYLTRTEAEELETADWSAPVHGILLGLVIGSMFWVGVLAYVSWRALS